MKEHSFRTVILRNGKLEKRKTLITFSDESYRIVSEFINGELPSFRSEISAQLDELKKGSLAQARFSGSRISFAAEEDRTLIYEDTDERMRWCEISTDEFLELIAEWEQERQTEVSGTEDKEL